MKRRRTHGEVMAEARVKLEQWRYRLANPYGRRHPDRTAAMRAVHLAVREGRLARWPVCAVPECECRAVEGHHADYSNPLGVTWLCRLHHRRLHIEFKRYTQGAQA